METASKRGNTGGSWFAPLLLGVAPHFAWVYLLFYSYAEDAGTAVGSPFPAAQTIFWGSGFFLAVVLAVLSLKPRLAPQACGRGWPRVVVPAAICLGTLATLVAVDGLVGEAAPGTLVVASALTGAGSAALACQWAYVFSRERIGVILLHGLPVTACVIAIVETLSYFPPVVREVAMVALPALSAWALARLNDAGAGGPGVRAGDRQTKGGAGRGLDSGAPAGRSLALLYTCVFILGGVPAYITASPDSSPIGLDAVFCMAATLGVFALVCVYVASFHRCDLLSSAALPIGVVVCVFIPAVASPTASPIDAFLPIGYICLEALLFLLALVCAKKAGASPVRTYAVGRIVYMAADILGYAAGTCFATDSQTRVMVEVALVLVGCIIILVSAMLLILTSSSGFFTRRQKGSEVTCGDATAAPQRGRRGDCPDTGQAGTAARRYSLTPRETEVFGCLVRGYSQQRIQEELAISKSTASFHIQNVYAKCGVHSRQELIDLNERQDDAR